MGSSVSDQRGGTDVIGLLFAILVTGAMCGAGYFFLIHKPNQAMAAAEPTNGTIVNTTVRSYTDTDNGGMNYQPVVTYNYTYKRTTLTDDNLEPGPGYRSYEKESKAAKIVDQYSVGQNVTVYVNPDKPTRAFLVKKGPGLFAYGWVGATGLGMLGAVAALVLGVGRSLLE